VLPAVRPNGENAAVVGNIYLNSYPMSAEGSVSLYKLAGAASSKRRKEIQRETGVSVWVEGDDAFAYREPSGSNAEQVEISWGEIRDLELFVLREALVDHCQALGFDAWIARAGEINVAGVTPPSTEDRFCIDHVLNLRISREEFLPDGPVLTARHRTSWRCIDPLSNRDMASLAPRQRAVRLKGDGPYRGKVVRMAGSSAYLLVGGREVEVDAQDYTLTANAALIARWRGSSALRKGRKSRSTSRRWVRCRRRRASRDSPGSGSGSPRGPDVSSVPGWLSPPVTLRFSPDIPSRTGRQAFNALRQHGPYDNSQLSLSPGGLLFVFPASEQLLARKLAKALVDGIGSYPGFAKLFRVDVATSDVLTSLKIDAPTTDLAVAGKSYRDAIAERSVSDAYADPELAIVLVPRTERFETQTPYYEAKAAFASLAIPTQMVSAELLRDESQFQWSVANIALAIFAKLGGIPWTVEAPAADNDLIVGVGRADVGRAGGRERHFGYAVTFVSNGIYRQTWSFTPTADDHRYEARLEEAVRGALEADLDHPPDRLIVHLAKKSGRREIRAAERAMKSCGMDVPVAFLRLDDSSLHDTADTAQATFAPPKGLVVKLGPRRALLQAEGLGALGPPDGPLLIELDERSTVDLDDFDSLVGQVFRLAHANWRGFNAQSKPATLVYGEQLASLVGHLQDVESWNPALLRSDLRSRPWFL
jgi:hypothetical protein